MTQRLRRSHLRLSLSAGALTILAAACVVEGRLPAEDEEPPPNPPVLDAGRSDVAVGEDAAAEPDATADGAAGEDACVGAACAPPRGCAAHPEASFCDDFDGPDALTPGKTKWDFIEPSAQPVVTLATDRAVSTPSSLLTRVIDADTPGAKFAKTITKAGFTEVRWEYDLYLDSVGGSDGFFLDDFQFSDAAGVDSFGFRLVLFAEAGDIHELKIEHNQQVTGGPYVIEPPLPAGTVSRGKWHHFAQTVTFTFAAETGDAGVDEVTYALTVDAGETPAFRKTYPGATRAQTAFARFAGMPFVFNKANSAGLAIYWDNHVVEMK